MIDVTNIKNYERTTEELQVFWLFCIFVAGRHADFAASVLEKFLRRKPEDMTPFAWLAEKVENNALHNSLVANRVGQYYRIERAIAESLSLDLATATVDELQQVFGVGPKTARMFVLYTRRDARVAVLDVHILRWLRDHKGYKNFPQSTPQTRTQYENIESIFLALAEAQFPGMSIADVDLLLWSRMSGRLEEDYNTLED